MMEKQNNLLLSYGINLFNKLRYNGILRVILDAFSKIGIKIYFYYRILERLDLNHKGKIQNSFSGYEFDFLKKDDLQDIAAFPLRNSYETESELQKRLEMGMKCFGAKHHGRVVAHAWYRLDYGELLGDIYPLKHREVYTFDVFTVFKYRGRGLMPYMTKQVHSFFRSKGIHKVWSTTNIFNYSYIRSKLKSNAQISEKGLLIILFDRLRYHRILKIYDNA